MNRTTEIGALYLLILGTTLPASQLGTLPGSLLSFGFFIVYLGLSAQKTTRFSAPQTPLLVVGGLATAYIIAAIFAPIQQGASIPPGVRVSIYFVVFFPTLFYLPKIIPQKQLFGVIARCSCIVILLGIPLVFIDQSSLLFNQRGTFWGVSIPYYRSYLLNQNTLGMVASFGVVAAFVELAANRGLISYVLIVLNFAGILASGSRNALLAAAVGCAIVGAYVLFRQDGVLGTVSGGCFAAVLSALMYVQVLPDPLGIHTISLTYRDQLWAASITAFVQQPWTGYGIGNLAADIAPYHTYRVTGTHNSYLRVFLATGILGGIFYVLLSVIGVRDAIRSSTDYYYTGASALLIAGLVMHIFESYTFLGLRTASFIPALMLGIVLTHQVKRPQ